jgi:hypothetical protein
MGLSDGGMALTVSEGPPVHLPSVHAGRIYLDATPG